LKASSKPAISIDGTVADLYRMGYADTPIKLHDIALVEVNPAGYKDQIQIIRITTDLLDPSATTLTIGSYIPNIVYIERQTNESATGSRGGGGGNKSNETAWKEFRTTMEAYEDGTGMRIRSVQNDLNNTKEEVAVQEAQIEVAYNRITQEVTDRRNADSTLQGRITVEANRITQEVTERQRDATTLSARITVEAGRITQEVSDRRSSYANLDSRITQTASEITAEVTRANRVEGELSGRITTTADAITAEVTRANAAEGALSSRITVNANQIELRVEKNGVISAINQTAESIKISANKIELDGDTVASSLYGKEVDVGTLNCGDAYTSDIAADGDVSATGKIYGATLGVGAHDATWKSMTLEKISGMTDSHRFLYAPSGTTATGGATGKLIASSSSVTIHYLGY
jgi:hypothetical protein